MKLVYFLVVVFFVGCAHKEYVHWDKPIKHIKKKSKNIVGINLEIPDYLLSGNFVEVKNNTLVYLKKEIPGIPQTFFERYLIDSLNIKLPYSIKSYPWDFNIKRPYKIYKIKILDYYKYRDNIYVLNYSINGDKFYLKKKINSNGYKKIFDMMINNISKQIKKEFK